MDIEKLKKLIEDGVITQAEFDALVQKIDDNNNKDLSNDDSNNNGLSADDLDKIIQSKVDKIVAKFGKEKADMKKELDALRKKNLSDEERIQVERQEKEQELAEKERLLKDRENRLFAVDAIKKAGLDDGSETSMLILDFVVSDTEETTNEKVKNFKALVDKLVENATNKRFKDNGRELSGGSSKQMSDNPWKKESWNITKQMNLELENPKLAEALKQEAGFR